MRLHYVIIEILDERHGFAKVTLLLRLRIEAVIMSNGGFRYESRSKTRRSV
jgi:hypothetical protein